MKNSLYICSAFNIEGNLKTNIMKTKKRSIVVTSDDLHCMQKYFTKCYYAKFLRLFEVVCIHEGAYYSSYSCTIELTKPNKYRLLTICKCFNYAIFAAGLLKDVEGYCDYRRLLDLSFRFTKCLLFG